MKNTDVAEFMSDLDGGAFERLLGKILSSVGAAVVDNGKVGNVAVKFKLSRIGSSHQVQIEHTIEYQRPTSRGKSSESDTGITPMYMHADGLTYFPAREGQGTLINKIGQAPNEDEKFPPPRN